MSRIYRLMAAGELANFHSGRSRRIPTQAVHDYMARQLAAADNGSARRQQASKARKRQIDNDGKGQPPAAALARTISKRGVGHAQKRMARKRKARRLHRRAGATSVAQSPIRL
jgi:hypothetical protein